MAILAIHQTPSLTRERYEEVVRRLTGGKSRLDSIADLPFEGIVAHATAQTENGFVVVDVFESEEGLARFGQTVAPIGREGGIEEPPKHWPAHTFIALRCPPRTSIWSVASTRSSTRPSSCPA